jgi:hypothetical protein
MAERVVPMIHVPDVGATVDWYESIGFTVLARYGDEDEGFAMLSFGSGEVMFSSGGQPGTPHRREVDLYVYSDNVDELYHRLKDRVEVVVIDRKTQKIIGSSRYFGFNRGKREIEIGWTFLARSHWGGKYNGELKRLMLDHAFKFVESVVFLIGPTNFRSQKAVEKIGGVMIEPRKKTIRGKTVEQVVYQIKKPTITAST